MPSSVHDRGNGRIRNADRELAQVAKREYPRTSIELVCATCAGGVLGVLTLGGASLIGCTGDNGSPTDSGLDSTAEIGPDSGRAETQAEAAVADAIVDMKAEQGDAAVMADAEAGARDGAAGDASSTMPQSAVAYPGQFVAALCAEWGNCCGAGFDQTTCKSDFLVGGWDNTLLNSDVYDAGHLTFNATQAASCITALQNWPCGAWTASANQAIVTACSNVLGGTIPIGSMGCTDSFECVSGAYCNGGTCTALVGSGGTCSRDFQCSYAGTKQPALYCNLYPPDGGSPATGTCAAPQADGTSSFCSNNNASSDFACVNRLCGDNTTCASTATNPATNACSIYRGG